MEQFYSADSLIADWGLIGDLGLGVGDYSVIGDWCSNPQSALAEYSAFTTIRNLSVNPQPEINESAMQVSECRQFSCTEMSFDTPGSSIVTP